MAKIYRRSDRIVVKIDDVIVKLAPLTLHQKTEVSVALMKGYKSTDIREATRGMALAIQFALKGIEGVLDSDNNPYELRFLDSSHEMLTDACVDDLMNLELTKSLALICSELAQGVPKEFSDENRNPLSGVEVVKIEKADSEKKN